MIIGKERPREAREGYFKQKKNYRTHFLLWQQRVSLEDKRLNRGRMERCRKRFCGPTEGVEGPLTWRSCDLNWSLISICKLQLLLMRQLSGFSSFLALCLSPFFFSLFFLSSPTCPLFFFFYSVLFTLSLFSPHIVHFIYCFLFLWLSPFDSVPQTSFFIPPHLNSLHTSSFPVLYASLSSFFSWLLGR